MNNNPNYRANLEKGKKTQFSGAGTAQSAQKKSVEARLKNLDLKKKILECLSKSASKDIIEKFGAAGDKTNFDVFISSMIANSLKGNNNYTKMLLEYSGLDKKYEAEVAKTEAETDKLKSADNADIEDVNQIDILVNGNDDEKQKD